MSEHHHLCWGWGPQYLFADRWEAIAPDVVPVSVERAAAVVEAIAREDPTALRRLGMSMGWLTTEPLAEPEPSELVERVLDDLERPTGRLALYERPRDDSLGQLDVVDDDDIVDLSDLTDQQETTWIEFRLHDQNDEPFAGLEYELHHADGRDTTGRLNELGIVHLQDIPAGDYTIRFPAAELVVLGEDGPPGEGLADYGVTRLQLLGTGGARSHGWTTNDDPPAADDEVGFFLASGAETIKITYTIEDPEGRTEHATLELFVLDDDGDEVILWSRPLTAEEFAAGDHEFDWNGQVDVTPTLPEGFPTVLRSPYTLRLRLRGHGEANPPEASTWFGVDVAAIELELGDEITLSANRDRTLHGTLGGSLPAAGATTKVELVSNVFKTSSAEMNSNALFTEYQSLWGRGPQIPVFAAIKAKDSQGNATLAPRALAGVKIAWEWIDVAEDTSSHHAKAKAYLDAALDFDKDLTEPAGDNCHVDRGGKRGPGADPVFPEQAGQAPSGSLTAGTFPFEVARYLERADMAITKAWTDGVVGGKTGVLFEPSRMAGDAWSLRVSLLRDMEENGPKAGAVQASMGTLETWRQVHVVTYLKKNAAIADVNIGTFQAYYRAAKVEMKDDTGGSQLMVEADYNAKVATAVAAQQWFVQAAIDGAVNQYTAGNYALHFRSYNDFKTAVRAAQGWSAAQLTTWLAGGGAAVNTASKYHGLCKSWASTITVAACNGYVNANPGVNILHFSGLYNLETQPGGRKLNGFAPSFAATGRTKCAFVLCPGPGNYGGGFNNAQQTLTHEIGHHMFLPHAPFPTASVPAGAQANRHDATYDNCTMSYDYSAERKFCGLCILRMRGWSADWLLPQPDENTRP
ncbi:hypothetical protein [Paraliomyxa miuraensis]|uniref:hypothetical protein n=1 Tax=Paraliomyxa miuraensis TaxID=376150 RepID=UPI00225303DA|nr:hypothetical protein [Paraliomyxa miuraensis]MCX4240635.1 hypothetical protein [Paraliomyxa miuraensis]